MIMQEHFRNAADLLDGQRHATIVIRWARSTSSSARLSAGRQGAL
jgi:hypothetical protein